MDLWLVPPLVMLGLALNPQHDAVFLCTLLPWCACHLLVCSQLRFPPFPHSALYYKVLAILTRFLRLHGPLASTQDKLMQGKDEILEERRSQGMCISLSRPCSCHLQYDHSSHWIALAVVSVHTSSPGYSTQLLVNSY